MNDEARMTNDETLFASRPRRVAFAARRRVTFPVLLVLLAAGRGWPWSQVGAGQEIVPPRTGDRPVDPEVEYWASRLKDPDSRVRHKAADKLGDHGVRAAWAVPALIDALGDPVGSVRKEIVDALGDIARRADPAIAERVFPALERVLATDADRTVRKEAVSALELTGREATLAVAARTLHALNKGFADPDRQIRGRTAGAVGNVVGRYEQRVRFQRFQLTREPEDGDDRSRGQLEESAGALREFEIAVDAAASALAGLYRGGVGEDREQLVETLGRIIRIQKAPGAPVAQVLADALGDPDEDVREEAAESLRELGPGSVDERTRAAPPVVVEALRRAYESGDVRHRREIVRVLRRQDPRAPEVVAALAGASRDPDRDIRDPAVDARGDIGREHRASAEVAALVVAPIAAALRDPEREIREEAARALGDMAAVAGTSVPALLAALEHPDSSTREKAADALGKIGRLLEPPDPSLVAGLSKALGDPEDDVREEAAEALGEMGPGAREAAEALRAAALDHERSVRKAAQEALRRIADR